MNHNVLVKALNQQNKINENVKLKALNQQNKINHKTFVRTHFHQQQGHILLLALKHLGKTNHIAQVQALHQQGNKL